MHGLALFKGCVDYPQHFWGTTTVCIWGQRLINTLQCFLSVPTWYGLLTILLPWIPPHTHTLIIYVVPIIATIHTYSIASSPGTLLTAHLKRSTIKLGVYTTCRWSNHIFHHDIGRLSFREHGIMPMCKTRSFWLKAIHSNSTTLSVVWHWSCYMLTEWYCAWY